jgi:hypothetical protein
MYEDDDINDLMDVVERLVRARPPADIVSKNIAADAPPLPVGPATVVHTEVLLHKDTGVPVAVDQFTTQAWIAKPFTKEDITHE